MLVVEKMTGYLRPGYVYLCIVFDPEFLTHLRILDLHGINGPKESIF